MNALSLKKGSSRKSAYNLRPTFSDVEERHTISVIVDNEAGVLARVIGLFSGRGYNIGGNEERTNIEVVDTLCESLDRLRPQPDSYKKLKTFVEDRKGHDRRYAIDASRIRSELGWRPSVTLDEGLDLTVQWFLDNSAWWRPLLARGGVGQRLGKSA